MINEATTGVCIVSFSISRSCLGVGYVETPTVGLLIVQESAINVTVEKYELAHAQLI